MLYWLHVCICLRLLRSHVKKKYHLQKKWGGPGCYLPPHLPKWGGKHPPAPPRPLPMNFFLLSFRKLTGKQL